MKILTACIVIICLVIAAAAASNIFTPIPEGGVCTADGQTINPEALKTKQVFWGIAIFVPIITLLIGAFTIVTNKDETRNEKIGSYILFASIILFVLTVVLSGV